MAEAVEFSTEEDTSPIARADLAQFNQAVLWGTDWTVETVLAQISRDNIEINPQFQRRDAWTRATKSRFIESVILGLPIPQVVLAEKADERGRYIILDGKQRLLSLMQFAELAPDSSNNGFSLSGLEARTDLTRKRYRHFQRDPELRSDLNAFLTHTIRAVVIRNWPSMAFLHVVFQRLNTGSLKLSPQELRQALAPGPFTQMADDYAVASAEIHGVLGRTSPDPRMRDTELLVRFISIQLFIGRYYGRLKEFIDESCISLNSSWQNDSVRVVDLFAVFSSTIRALSDIFGENNVARKMNSSLFNRSIFDALAYYAADPTVRAAMIANPQLVIGAYGRTLLNDTFQQAVESDTAGIPHTLDRLTIWGTELANALGIGIRIPSSIVNADGQTRIVP